MTLQNIKERAQDTFPKIQEAWIIKEVDYAQKLFCDETYTLETEGQLSDANTNVDWDLPSNYLRLNSLDMYDSDGDPVYKEDISINYTTQGGVFSIFSLTSTPITGFPATVSTAYLVYGYSPTTLTAITDSLEIDEEFHDAIEAKVMERLYAKNRVEALNRDGNIITRIDTTAITYWSSVYVEARKRAKRRINNDKNVQIELQNYGYAGRFSTIKRAKRSASVTILPTTVGFSKYVRYKVTSPTTVSVEQSIGWTVTPTGAVAGGVFTATTTAEWTETMLWEMSYAMRHSRTDANDWAFTLPGTFGSGVDDIIIEIYERS